MKALILAERYPDNDGSVALMYIHTRNLYYAEHGIDVTVLNFRATTGYRYQGIRVITWKEYAAEKSNYDLLVLHAPNVKNHYRFLTIYGDRFPKFVFFYHGHEVLKINQVYSKPYPFVHVNCIKKSIQEIYDTFKLTVWRRYLPTQAHKSHYVFVSRWMYEEFLKWTRIPKDTIRGKYSITYNCVGKSFENETFDTKSEKQYDFVTIRSNLDVSKYAVDIVNRLAKNTPGRKFLLVGKGDFFLTMTKLRIWSGGIRQCLIRKSFMRCKILVLR